MIFTPQFFGVLLVDNDTDFSVNENFVPPLTFNRNDQNRDWLNQSYYFFLYFSKVQLKVGVSKKNSKSSCEIFLIAKKKKRSTKNFWKKKNLTFQNYRVLFKIFTQNNPSYFLFIIKDAKYFPRSSNQKLCDKILVKYHMLFTPLFYSGLT